MRLQVLICPDSFKESLSALEAARAMRRGLRLASSDIACEIAPISDGGEGFVDALLANGGSKVSATVSGPLSAPADAFYGILPDGETAVIEMAAAAGLQLVPQAFRDPLRATTFGVGELMGAAISSGARRLLIGIGGSATTDGGTGMASALGARFLDAAGNDLPPGGGSLLDLERIDPGVLPERMKGIDIRVASDVRNPLHGPDGAAHVYGPQKGASPSDVELLDRGLQRLADVFAEQLGRDVRDLPGAGAAGGLGAGLAALCGAEIASGFEIVRDACHLVQRAEAAEWILTGEGRTDAQTLSGKVVSGVLELASRTGTPCIVLSGALAERADELYGAGAAAVLSTAPGPISLEACMQDAARLLESSARALGGIMMLSKDSESAK